MKRLKQSTAAKLIAAILLAALVTAFFAAGTAVILASEWGMYEVGYDAARERMLDTVGMERVWDTGLEYDNYNNNPENIYRDSGFTFKLYDENKKLIYDGLKGRKTVWQSALTPYSVWKSSSPTGADPVESKVFIEGFILEDIPATDSFLNSCFKAFDLCYAYRDTAIVTLGVTLLAGILLFVFLMAAAGHRPDGTVRGGFVERIPFDVLTCAAAFAVIACIAMFAECLNLLQRALVPGLALCAAFVMAGSLIYIVWCMDFAVHIKLRDTLRSCLVWRICAWLVRLIKKPLGMALEVLKNLPLIPKAGLIVAGILFVEFIWIAAFGNGEVLIGWLLERLVLVVLTLYTLLCMKRLLAAGKEIAGGNLSSKVDTDKMYGPLKEHAESLNNITDGLNNAVSESMKSERLKTELITNVSHDIKTPLTSIVNYVDLLEKEQPENERMREYLEVLSRQSARLKKLIEDLIEASKASTGSLTVNLEPCILNVLIEQVSGDYAERLEAKALELIVTKPDESVTIMGDGRHMWRIFDNLLNNICKYAKPGTRVYINLDSRDKRAEVIFRNISENRLNVSGNELAERFVRGDASRNTEGSGLGLSIAQSLTNLQNGKMTVGVDGDLFKVTLEFPLKD